MSCPVLPAALAAPSGGHHPPAPSGTASLSSELTPALSNLQTARPYLMALLSPATPPLKAAMPLPPPRTQCFRCLSTDHLVADCRDPVRCRACLRFGHRSSSCAMSVSLAPPLLGALCGALPSVG
jgi:hypothetical protein